MSYNGYANWGTWHIALLVGECEDLEEQWGERLASFDFDPSWTYFNEGAAFVKAQVEELADEEQCSRYETKHFTDTLMTEGVDHIDWDGLAKLQREVWFEAHELTEAAWVRVEEWDRDEYVRMNASERAEYLADLEA